MKTDKEKTEKTDKAEKVGLHLSDDGIRVVSILKQMRDLAEQLANEYDKLDMKDALLVGAADIHLFSPIGQLGVDCTIGHANYINGIRTKTETLKKSSSVEERLGALLALKSLMK